MDTVSLTIDGKTVTAEKGRTVLQAAIEAGIRVPYYCYHPGLGIDGSCRVCIVKIEKMPKLQTSCSTPVAEGMVVHTQTPDVVDARASVFEFLLINHPLDCPVCDKGGECPLQDFSYSFGPNESRMGFERRVFDGEGVKADVDFGPTLMLNRNRCILCTRCVRFMKEVDTDAQINITDRGYGSEIATFQEEGVHSILSGNLMDVCPVGAITTRDYRFKARPWDNPEAVDTICTLCEKGCNTTAWLKAKPEWAKGARLARMTPRFNPDVNSYWMCDIGRFQYHWVEGDERLTQPLVRSGGAQTAASWSQALATLSERVVAGGGPSALRFLLSAHASLEELSVLGRLGGAFNLPESGVALSWRTTVKSQPAKAKFQVPSVDAPNVRGARDLGFPVSANANGEADLSGFRADVEAGRVAALYVFDPGPDGSIGDVSWIINARKSGKLPFLVVHGVLLDGSGQGRGRCASRRVVDREGRDLRQHGRPPAGVVAGNGLAGRSAGGLEDPFGRRSRARRRCRLSKQRRDSNRARFSHGQQSGVRKSWQHHVRAAGPGEHLAADVESVRALEVGLHVPGPAAGQVRGPSRVVVAAGGDSDEGS